MAQKTTKPVVLPSLTEVNEKSAAIRELPPTRLRLTPAQTLDGRRERFEQINAMRIGPAGQLALVIRTPDAVGGASKWETLRLYDSTGRRLWSLAGSGGDGELGRFSAFGWTSSGMWVFDDRFSQVALIEGGQVTKSLELPEWYRPSWAQRKSFPVYGAASIFAMLPDGSYIGMPRRAHSLMGAAQYDSTKDYIM